MKNKNNEQAVFRIKTAIGQLTGVLKMIEEGKYCMDISQQLQAVSTLVRRANLSIIERHMKTCVVDAINTDNGDAKIEEIIKILDRTLGSS